MTPFGRFYLYEFLPDDGILHVNYQNVSLQTEQDVAALFAEFYQLLDGKGVPFVVGCFDGIEFSQDGAESFFQHVVTLQQTNRLLGVVRYVTGRVRMDKRFHILSETSRQRLIANLCTSKDEAFKKARLFISQQKK
jgi:hypothetical protein